ncbi:MAG: four helix bundle protein [Candidatus Levybacteria bacterium]|nr:four helix bundle protein [Candidatus Levybacteria bacterium]
MNTTQEKADFKKEFKKRCFLFSLKILELSEDLKGNRTNWPLLDQVVRSGTSIGANVVEGGNSTSKREYINYFNIALKSASETLYWLALIKETNLKKMDKIEKIYNECEELKRLLSTIILNTKSNSKI